MGLWFGSLSLWNGPGKDTQIGVHVNRKSPGIDGLQSEGGSRGTKGLSAAASERHLQGQDRKANLWRPWNAI